MPTIQVTIKGLHLQFDFPNFKVSSLPLPASPVFFKTNLDDNSRARGVTDANGICICEVEEGVWICTAKVVDPFIDPFIGSVEIFKDLSIELPAAIDAKDCENIILLLRRLTDKANKTEDQIKKDLNKAKRLIKRIKGTYGNYKELPVLFQIADLEKKLPGYVPGKDDGVKTPEKQPSDHW